MAEQKPRVWLVEQGPYSGYRVVGVYSTREYAQAAADYLNQNDSNKWDEATVAERALDPSANEINAGLTQWSVHMRRDGAVSYCEPEAAVDEPSGHVTLSKWNHRSDEKVLTALVWAESQDHAVKIVNEKRAQMIASGEWGPQHGPSTVSL